MRIVFTILSMLIFLNLVQAQNKVKFGVKFGLGIGSIESNVKSTESFYNNNFKNNRLGPFLGIFTDFDVLNNLKLDIELNYVQKGAEDEFEITTLEQPEGTGEKASFDYQLDYLQLVPSLKPTLSTTNFDIYLKFGASINYLLKVRGAYQLYDSKELVFGYNLGFGVKLKNFFDRSLLFEICRDTDIQNFYTNSIYELKNNIWLIKIGFFYN